MEMKDKLVKTGHKRGYYLAKETFVGFLAVVCLFSMVAIPTYIASNAETNHSLKEEQKDDNDDSEEILTIQDDK